MFNNITDVPGIEVGHVEDKNGVTGCTAVVAKAGAVCGVDVRGSAPGTRETDALDPINQIQQVHAISLAGGSAFGLDAATGIMRYLAEQKIGVDVHVATIPIVPGAIIFDLFLFAAITLCAYYKPNLKSLYRCFYLQTDFTIDRFIKAPL